MTTVFRYIGAEPEPEGRRRIEVSPEDAESIDGLRRRPDQPRTEATVTDLSTGERLRVEAIACSLPNCMCAIGIVSEAG